MSCPWARSSDGRISSRPSTLRRRPGFRSSSSGPTKDPGLAEELRRRGARLEGYVATERLAELYRGAACLVQSSRYEGFGLPVLEAMASGTPVVAVPDAALREVAGDAAIFVEENALADGIRQALAGRDAARRGWARTRSRIQLARRCRTNARRLPGDTRDVKVSAVVVSHGHADELKRSLPALVAQVDETLVIGNLPGSARDVPTDVRVLENPRALTFAENVNVGIASTSGEYVLVANPDAIAEPDAVATLVAFADAHPRCGIAGPQMRWPDGTWQPSRRRFPTVRGTVVRRTPLRRLRPPYETQREHYALDQRPTEPVQADWMLGAFLLMRRTMLDEIDGWDAGYRHYCEDIDLCYRAAQAGWERWYVPGAVVTHAYAAVIDQRFLSRHTLWHARGMARFVRKHPERLLAL